MRKTNLSKQLSKVAVLFILVTALLSSCKTKDPDPVVPGSKVVTLKGEIKSNRTLSADSSYLLNGFVYVTSGATITIPAGTVIKGDKLSKGTLIIEPGAKITAIGTPDKPIIFTSNLPVGLKNLGDWGGLVLVGKAPHNQATATTQPQIEGGPRTTGGSPDGQNLTDNSGTLQYVRIEYAGVALSPNNEINGLTLFAVGSGTTIDHVQVTFANDDSIEWFGGTVNLKRIICFRGIDDDFDTDNGYSGNVQFGLGVRDLTIADQSGSKGFESDNDATGDGFLPKTLAVFSNMTLIGPNAVDANGKIMKTDINQQPANPSANYTAGIHLRRNSSLSTFNTIIMGWPCGVLVDYDKTLANINAGTLVMKNNLMGGIYNGKVTYSDLTTGTKRDLLYLPAKGDGSITPAGFTGMSLDSSQVFPNSTSIYGWWAANKNVRYVSTDEVKLTMPFGDYLKAAITTKFNALPATGSPALGFASFADPKVSGTFFEKVTYAGALATDNNFSTEAWVNFDPQNTDYPNK